MSSEKAKPKNRERPAAFTTEETVCEVIQKGEFKKTSLKSMKVIKMHNINMTQFLRINQWIRPNPDPLVKLILVLACNPQSACFRPFWVSSVRQRSIKALMFHNCFICFSKKIGLL